MRTFRTKVHVKYAVELPSSHPLMQWAMRHAAWVRERFTVDSREHATAYERHMLCKHISGLATPGETVVWRQPGQHKLKLKEHWGFGIWLGFEATSDSHIIGTRHGCFTARAIRRLPPSEREDKHPDHPGKRRKAPPTRQNRSGTRPFLPLLRRQNWEQRKSHYRNKGYPFRYFGTRC